MEFTPWPYDPEADLPLTEEETYVGGRNVVVGIGPVLTGYDFFTESMGKRENPDVSLSEDLLKAAREFSNADHGNVYYEAHVKYLKRVVGVVKTGGSALFRGQFAGAAIDRSTEFPQKLFENLDREWQDLARDADKGHFGLKVPPVLSIVLTRCARREAIPAIITDLRAEWADARAKVWALVDRLKTASTPKDILEVKRELEEASLQLSLSPSEIDTEPIRVLWKLLRDSAVGAVAAGAWGSQPEIGAIVGGLTSVSNSVPPLVRDLGPVLFGRGAFDLARKIRREALRVEYDALARLLTSSENQKLGLGARIDERSDASTAQAATGHGTRQNINSPPGLRRRRS